MDLKEFDLFKERVIKKIREKYKVDSYLKVLEHIIRITVEEFEKRK